MEGGRGTKPGQCKCGWYDVQDIWWVWILQLLNGVILTWKKNCSTLWCLALLSAILHSAQGEAAASAFKTSLSCCVCVCVCAYLSRNLPLILLHGRVTWSLICDSQETNAFIFIFYLFLSSVLNTVFSDWCSLIWIHIVFLYAHEAAHNVGFVWSGVFSTQREREMSEWLWRVWLYPVFKELLTAVLNVSINLYTAIKSKAPHSFRELIT